MITESNVYTFTDNNGVKYYFQVHTDDRSSVPSSYSYSYNDNFFSYVTRMIFSISGSDYTTWKEKSFHADDSNIIYTDGWDTCETTHNYTLKFKDPTSGTSYSLGTLIPSVGSGYGIPYAYYLFDIVYFPNASNNYYFINGRSLTSGSGGFWSADTSYNDRIVWTSSNSTYIAPSENQLGNITISIKGTLTQPNTYSLQNCTEFGTWLTGNASILDKDDPNPGGESGTSDTGGTSDMGGDTIEDTGVPTIQATDSGLMTLYNPDVSTLRSLGQFLWSDSLDINSFKKLFNDPFDTLLGLSIVPIQPNHSGTQNIMFGNLDTGISCPVIGNQFVEVDMGTLSLNEVWAGALDYTPNTQVSIYLPFIGERQLNTNDVMNSSIQLKYKFDILTGGCVAQLYVTYNKTGNKKSNDFSFNSNAGFLCSYEGQASINLPLSSMDYTNTIRAMIGAVGMVAGASASFATGNPALGVAALAVGTANSTIQGSSPTVERTGHLSSSNALMDNLQPHLTVCRPHQCKPKYFYQYRGIPSQVYVKNLKDVSGFVQIAEDVHIDAEGATDSELNEIKQLLQEGVLI